MKQYLDLLKDIKFKGTKKPGAREGMPGTTSLFGYQFRHDLGKGFPLLTTKKMYWKGVVVELLWFLRGDTNIKYLVDNGVNIWNEDAYKYYLKVVEENTPKDGRVPATFDQFIEIVKRRKSNTPSPEGYLWGDCGYQYGKVWRDWGGYGIENLDQIRNLIIGLRNSPQSRRHIVTAVDPENDKDLALYWCHSMFQFNCRPLTATERTRFVRGITFETDIEIHELADKMGAPKYYLDCQMYQRSADVFLGVPFNIASYALLTHVVAELCNMVPGEYIHTFGDVHIYDDHMDAVNTQLERQPDLCPTLRINTEFWRSGDGDLTKQDPTKEFFDKAIRVEDFQIENYNPAPSIKAKLSTGLK